MFHSIRWRIALPYVCLILIVMTLLVFYLSAFVRDVYLSGLREQMFVGAGLVGDALSASLQIDVARIVVDFLEELVISKAADGQRDLPSYG